LGSSDLNDGLRQKRTLAENRPTSALRTLQTFDPQSEMHDLKPFQVLSVESVEDVSAFNFMFQYDSFGANKKWGLP